MLKKMNQIERERKLRDILLNGPPPKRKYICSHSFRHFCVYYFTDYFTYQFAPFHYDFFKDIEDLGNQRLREAVWIAFRESGKTSLAKLGVLWLICFNKKKYIGWDSYEKTNAEMALFDIAVELQTNRRLIADFGNLYVEKRTDEEKKLKRISQFITANGIMVRALSTQESPRGWLYKNQRPDFICLDDVENFKTITSNTITEKIISHINELRAGLPLNAGVLYLGNYLREDGVMAYCRQAVKAANGRERFISAIIDGKPAWLSKYVLTDAEAIEINRQRLNKNQPLKISLEERRRTLNIEGRKIFEAEMLNDPGSSAFQIFDRVKIEALISKAVPPKADRAGFLIWEDYNPSHRYGLGADTAKGVGRDSSASVLIDFSVNPNKVVGAYANNQIAPDIFAHELKRQAEMYGECLIGPELNNQGYATITELKKIYPLDKIYRRREKGKLPKAIDRPRLELGFETNPATKPELIYKLKSAVEDGYLEIPDKRILEEMKRYNQADLEDYTAQTTRHFDLLMATAIAWHLRNYVEEPKKTEEFQNEPYEPSSEFETDFKPRQPQEPFFTQNQHRYIRYLYPDERLNDNDDESY